MIFYDSSNIFVCNNLLYAFNADNVHTVEFIANVRVDENMFRINNGGLQ